METTNQTNKKVSVLGLGQMGYRIAQLYSEAGYEVTAWNRTPGKGEGLEKVQLAETAEQAILASPVVIAIILNNKGVFELLNGLTDIRIFTDKALINFTSGSTAEADRIEKIISDAGGAYIHGAIQASPEQLGLRSATIVISGSKEAFERYENDLTIIGGKIRYLSDRAAASLAMDTATSTWVYGAFVGLLYGAELCRQYNLSLKDYADIIGDISPEFIDYFKQEVMVVDRNDFRLTSSSVSLHLAVVQRLADSFKDVNVKQDFPTIIRDLLAEAEQKGFGEEELAAITKVIAPRT